MATKRRKKAQKGSPAFRELLCLFVAIRFGCSELARPRGIVQEMEDPNSEAEGTEMVEPPDGVALGCAEGRALASISVD
jgi:hypothetical protein